MSDDIYIPPGAISLDKADYLVQLRLGISGLPATGKTYSSVGFPNPICLSFDRGLVSHIGDPRIIEIPFYDDEFVNKLCPKVSPMYSDLRDQSMRVRPANRKDALPLWLNREGVKLTAKQTLIIDGGTGIQAAYHQGYWTNPKMAQKGAVDSWGEWNWKIDYFTEIMMCFKALKCNIIYICHETEDRDADGIVHGIRPLLRGQFQNELQSHFTDWFRALVFPKPTPEKIGDFKKFFSLNSDSEYQEWITSTDSKCGSIFVWQTQPDNLCKCRTSLINAPKYVLANYKTFEKYKRKPSTE